jgi:dipeptidyl aminopeptidase/acylaminoacyl peptidase
MSFSLPDGRSRRWDEARAFAEKLLAPGFGKPQSGSYPSLHPPDDVVAATADVRESMEGHSAAYVARFRNGEAELVRKGSRPAFSPDGTRLAHIADEGVYVDDTLIEFKGAVERLAWNPDGTELLIVLAEPGSQLSNVAAGGLLPPAEPWLPQVSSSQQFLAWRRLIVIDVATSRSATVGRADLNVWDAAWAGNDAVVAVCTDGSPTEGAWYAADVRRIEIATGADAVVAKPAMQLGALAASPSGRHLAYVEAVCSDRDIAAGELFVVDLVSGDRQAVDASCDVTDVQFIDDDRFGFCGMRNLTTVVGTSTVTGEVTVAWESERDTILGIHPHASFRGDRIAFITGGHKSAPAVGLLRDGSLTTVASMAHAGTAPITDAAWTTEHRTWNAPDGREIDGWLLTPAGAGPHPLITWVHGGPLWSHRSNWMGTSVYVPFLLEHGYAVFQPNPRGSSGKGREFGVAVVNDMGGADTHDIISGVQSLVDAGIADPARLGVTGGSYGGFMTAWLITQTDLFRAAIAQYPVTDWSIQHAAASIPEWDEQWLDGKPYATDGQYRARSPITHAANVTTPTLFIAGALDGCVPPAQALAMHRALVAHGVPTDCVTYPQEGHGARDLSAVVDVGARIIDWFDEYLGGENGR